MVTVLITGATRGLGMETAAAVLARGHRVLCAGRTRAAVEETARRLGAEPVVMDLADLGDVREVVAGLPHVDAVACNAGVQILRGRTTTVDGFEEAFQVNHLAHVALVDQLLARPAPPARVVFVGSATHDPAVRTGTPPPFEDDDLASLGRPRALVGPARTDGMRRYVTTKLLATAMAGGLARERPDVRVISYDPGMMPGTGLARQYPATVRALWSTVFKGLTVLPFASSPATSGEALAALLCDDPPAVASGAHVDYRLKDAPRSARAADPRYQDAVVRRSRSLLTG